MTIPSQVNRSGPYTGNGATTAFDYKFKILNQTHIRVISTSVAGVDSDLVLTTNYTVTGVGVDGGGQVVLTAPLPAGVKLTLLLNVPFTQEIALVNQGAYYANVVEEGFDLNVMRLQQLQEQLSRTVTVPPSADSATIEQLIGNILELTNAGGSIDVVAGVASYLPTVAGLAGDIPTVAGNTATTITKAGEAAGSATAAAGSAVLAGQYANNPEDVAITGFPGSFSAKHFMLKSKAIFDNLTNTVAGWVHGAAEKTALLDADEFGIADSAAAFGLKKATMGSLRASIGPDFFEGFDATRVNNSQITFSAGTIKGNGRLATLAAPITKDLAVAWVAGTGGGRDTGSEQAQAGVHYFVIQNIATPSSVDILVSHSATAPTIPAGWAMVGRVFSYWNDASSNLVGFQQVNKRVYFSTAVDWLSSYTGTISSTVTGPPAAASVPSGIRVDLLLYATCRTRSSGTTTVACYDADPTSSVGVGILNYLGAVNADTVTIGRARTNITRQCRLGVTNVGAGSNIDLTITGFDDYTLPKKEKAF